MPELDGEIALVTGASRGLGAAIASALAARGARVFGTATSEAGAAAIGERLGGPERGLVLDVRDSAVVTFVLDTLKERAGDPGILVNNAGVTRDNLLLRMREEEWQDVLDTDLTSIYRLCKAALRGMTRARKGRIINIASVVGLTGNPGQCNYAAAKAGIIGFSKALALEVASRNITVNVVAPGFIATDMTSALDDAQRAVLAARIPLARLGTPEDIAQAVAFLASPAAAYITGETLHVNGGMYMP
jgi:3-oxoacyl-[acyl-carrier protein] reductase